MKNDEAKICYRTTSGKEFSVNAGFFPVKGELWLFTFYDRAITSQQSAVNSQQ